MMIKKYKDFIIKESFEKRVLLKNKESLLELIRKNSNNEEEWGHNASLISDMAGVFYDSPEYKDLSFEEASDKIINEYGTLLVFIALISGYIGQVNNGGHFQYFDNGYASARTSGAFQTHDNIENHELLLELWEESGFNSFSKNGAKVLDIAKDFTIEEGDEECEECGGSGSYEEEDEEGEYYDEQCFTCGGDGYIESNRKEVVNPEGLDSIFYKSSKHIIQDLENFAARLILD